MNFFSIIIKNLLRRKVRTLLTCIGVSVAIASMIMLMGVSNGLTSSTIESYRQHGVDIITIEASKPNQFASDLDYEMRHEIRKLPGVRDVAGALVEFLSTKSENGNELPVVVFGWKPGTFQFDSLQMLDGRKLKEGDERAAMLGEVIASNLRKKVGDTIELLEEEFKVVGIYRAHVVFENGGIVLPLQEMQRLLSRPNSVSGFAVILDQQANVPVGVICQQINALKSPRDNVRMQAQPTEVYVNSSIHIQTMQVAAWLTALIAVISGTIYTLNTMSMSVFERFREIGTLRAIGWGRGRIVRMILGESLLLGIGGAVIGIVCALLFMRGLGSLPATSGLISGNLPPMVIVQGFLVAVLVGVLGGIMPAYRAARLLPTEALRYD